MSAKRLSLLAAATVCGILTPTAPCWAQVGAYGAEGVVNRNDFRWFEPVELDLDGQMPRDKAGAFFTADKLWWGVVNPKVEIGSPGLTVDSERIYRAPSNDLAFAALDQVQGLGFISDLDQNLRYNGIRFVVANTRGTDVLNDDITSAFDAAAFATVADLEAAIDAFNSDPVNIANDLTVRVGGEPKPYAVRNGILDALPDAGFAWGERYEFGYSDGERGWMLTVLDGPEANAGGRYGAGPGERYFSQSGTNIPGIDPWFDGNGIDDNEDGVFDGDGEQGAADIFAFGFGSVPVNFNLPSPDFLDGYRDYYDNNVGASGGTTAGPLMYVGNYGAQFTEISTTDITNNPSAQRIGIDDAITAIDIYFEEANDPPTVDPDELVLSSQISAILDDLNAAGSAILSLEEEDQVALQLLAANAFNAVNALQLAQANLAAGNAGMVPPNQLNAQINAVNTALINLNVALAGISLVVEGDGADQQLDVTDTQRIADDLDGNGSSGTVRVLADIDGDGTIEAGEVIGLINNFGDLHTFNVFFDEVTVRNRTEIDGVELMRTFDLSTNHKLQQGRWDDLRLAYGVRFLNVEDDFFFQGLGSILGRTTVETNAENQIVGPQIGLKWTRRDGPWDFILEGRGTIGYNIVDVDQRGIFGEELLPGALNRPVVARTTASQDGRRYDEFSPLGELRAQLRYRLAESVSLQAGYTAKFVGNIHRGSDSTQWNAPYYGIHDHTGDIFINGLNIGVDLRY